MKPNVKGGAEKRPFKEKQVRKNGLRSQTEKNVF